MKSSTQALHTENAQYSLGNPMILNDGYRKRNLRRGMRKKKEGGKPRVQCHRIKEYLRSQG